VRHHQADRPRAACQRTAARILFRVVDGRPVAAATTLLSGIRKGGADCGRRRCLCPTAWWREEQGTPAPSVAEAVIALVHILPGVARGGGAVPARCPPGCRVVRLGTGSRHPHHRRRCARRWTRRESMGSDDDDDDDDDDRDDDCTDRHKSAAIAPRPANPLVRVPRAACTIVVVIRSGSGGRLSRVGRRGRRGRRRDP